MLLLSLYMLNQTPSTTVFDTHRRTPPLFYKFSLPAVIGAAVALNWDRTFVTFHEIAFNNDYWLFDPATDPVINILPDLYFLHCAVMILALVILGSILCAWAYRAEKRKNNK